VQDHLGDSKIYAFDKRTGELRWEKDRDEPSTWATPLSVMVDGALQVITAGPNFIRAYDAITGDIVWQCRDPNPEEDSSALASPVAGSGKVYCPSGFLSHTVAAIELGRTGDLSESNAYAWLVTEGAPYVPSLLLYGDRLYFVNNNKPRLSCYKVDTGEPAYADQRLEGIRNLYASPVGAAGRIYLADRKGNVMVIKHSDTFEVLATNTLDEGFDASPVIAGDELFLKGEHHLYCIAEK